MLLRFILSCAFVAVALLSGFTNGATQLRVKLSARGLPHSDPFSGYPDPYLIISYAYGVSEEFERVGVTSVRSKQDNPQWPELYDFVFVPGASQRLHFAVWDEDFDANDHIGDVQIFLEELSEAANGTLVKPIQPAGKGNLIITNLLPTKLQQEHVKVSTSEQVYTS